jgi:hypothetical protein
VKLLGRQKQLRFLLVLTSVLALFIAGFTVAYMPRIRNQSLSDLMHMKTSQTADRFRFFMLPIVSNLQLLREWGQRGILDPTDATSLDETLVPLLDTHLPHVGGFMLADTEGNEYSLLRIDNAWSRRPADEAYDPRKSPWFQGAIDVIHSNEIYWTPVYAFPVNDRPGSTASMSFRSGGGEEKTSVVALKMALQEIEVFLSELPLGEGGRLLLVEEDFVRDFTRLKEDTWQQGDIAALTSLSLLKEPDVAAGLSQWQNSGSPLGTPLFFPGQNQRWWIEVNSIPFGIDDEAQLAVILKDSHLQGEISRLPYILLFSALALLVIVLGIFLVLSRRYGRTTEAMLARRNYTDASEEDLRSLIQQGEDDDLEFKSTLRWNLKTEKPDKNVSLASLKTIAAFLNSKGGTLLVGVDDEGEVLGIDLQNFSNEDKYLLHFNNLLKQHIGLEFVKFISFGLKRIEGKKILVVDCEPAGEPVFLAHEGEEEFYVRVGPGSRRLPTSKVLDYLKSRDLG